jgi:hypothetical protein
MRSFLVGCLFLPLVGCGDKAKDLYDTAQLKRSSSTNRALRNFIGRS